MRIAALELELNAAEFPTQVMLDAEHLAFGFPGQDRPLFAHLNLTVERTDRIGIIGRNGKGKTTLMRVLMGELDPKHGRVKRHPRLQTAYFGQTNIDRLDPDKTVEEEILDSDPTVNRRRARDLCGAMMFSGDTALKKVSVLSGGERARVLMGKLLVTPAHLLMLDEPSNHLDLESSEALMEALNAFPGAVLIVTHNEDFLHALINKFVIFDHEGAFTYTGTYQSFLDELGWEGEEVAGAKRPRPLLPVSAAENEAPAGPTPAARNTEKALKKAKADLQRERSQTLKPLEALQKELEQSIQRLETEKLRIESELVRASEAGDAPALADLPKRMKEVNEQMEFLYGKLETATRELEQKTAHFNDKLKKLE